jgi:hypothetical protein
MRQWRHGGGAAAAVSVGAGSAAVPDRHVACDKRNQQITGGRGRHLGGGRTSAWPLATVSLDGPLPVTDVTDSNAAVVFVAPCSLLNTARY